jgi:hypothetical protein
MSDSSSLLADPEFVAALGPHAIGPDVPVETRREIKRSPRFEAFRKAAEYCARLRHVEMNQRQQAIGRFNEQIEYKTVDGLGTKVGEIDMEMYFQMRAKYGDDCWDDPEFIKAFLRDNPAARIKTTRGTKGQSYLERRT